MAFVHSINYISKHTLHTLVPCCFSTVMIKKYQPTLLFHSIFVAAVIVHPILIFAASSISSDLFAINKHQLSRKLHINMADQNQASPEKRWFPLESNPSLLNQYISKLGFDTHMHGFTDVFSTEQWALDMVPHPVLAVMVLFPMTEKVKNKRQQLHTNSLTEKSDAASSLVENENGVWYIKQRIRNACGTIAVLHALANVPKSIQETCIRPSSWLDSFIQNCPASSSPTEKAIYLEHDTTIETYHEDATNDGQTSRGTVDDDIDLHFISFVHVNGKLYELDGRVEQGPVCHGCTTQQDLLKDACGVVQQLMEADPSDMRFTILAFAPANT